MISTHVLDTAKGAPGVGIHVSLSIQSNTSSDANDAAPVFTPVASGTTNDDGRLPDWLDGKTLNPGTYRIHFDLEDYLTQNRQPVFYPHADIVFVVADPAQHFHIPLLLSPYGYSTYRGS